MLAVLMKDHKRTKSTIKEQAKLFGVSESEELFGRRFRKHVVETAKVKKESKEVYRKQGSERKLPFQKGPSLQRGKGGRTAIFSKLGNDTPKFNAAATSGRGRDFHGKEKCERTTLPQHGQPGKDLKRNTRNIAHRRASKCSPGGKKNVPSTSQMGLPPGRKTAIFCKKLAGFNKQSRNFRNCVRIKNPIYGRAKTDSTPLPSENEQGAKCYGKPGDPSHVEERGCSRGRSSEGPISEQPIFSKKERWGEQTSDKFEATECVHSLPTFQNGGSASVERDDAGERLYVQDRSEGCILLPPPTSNAQKICPVSMGGQNFRVFLPMFWP